MNSLVALTRPAKVSWELIVVDNNSTDETRPTVAGFQAVLPLRYVFEPLQGLSAARNRAIREFTGDVLLFTDDDVVVDQNWLRAFESASSSFPLAGYFGGRVIPFYPSGKPGWLQDEGLALLSGLLVRYHLGESTRRLLPCEPTPFGASFGIRRHVIHATGEFRCDLGVIGGVPGRGEESEYLHRVRAAGYDGVYVGDAIAHHSTDPRRLTLGYLFRYGVQTGVAESRTGSTAFGSITTAVAFAARGCVQLLRGRGDRFRQCVINIGIQMALRRTPNRVPRR